MTKTKDAPKKVIEVARLRTSEPPSNEVAQVINGAPVLVGSFGPYLAWPLMFLAILLANKPKLFISLSLAASLGGFLWFKSR